MIFHPPILALILASGLSAALAVWAALFAVKLLARWDLASGAEAQLLLERQTYLVSTVLAFVMVVELASLVLFVFNADRMAPMFVGAMCAVGVLNASVYGFPALLAKIAVFFAASLWLSVNRADGLGRDYPLIRIKYRLLLGLAPLVLLAAGLQLAFFLDIKADTITSCCGKLFAPEKEGLAAEMAGISERTALWLLYGGLAVTAALGGLAWVSSNVGAKADANANGSLGATPPHPAACAAALSHGGERARECHELQPSPLAGEDGRRRRPGEGGVAWAITVVSAAIGAGLHRHQRHSRSALIAYGLSSAAFFAIALTAIVSVISLYIYEHPHHHCPFCLLKREYGHFGFFLYLPLFAGTALGLSAGFLGALERPASLNAALPALNRRFVAVSVACLSAFGAMTVWAIASSKLVLLG